MYCQTNANSSQCSQAGQLSGRVELPPLGESGGSAGLEVLASGEAAVLVEVVGDGGVDGGEELKRLHPPEAEHRPLSSPERRVRVLDPVVRVPCRMLTLTRTEFPKRCSVGAQPVGDDLLRSPVSTHQFPQELQRCLAIAGLGDNVLGQVPSAP